MSDRPDVAVAAPVERTQRPRIGFLPIQTNSFDRVFIAVVAFVAIHLFWMRFLEPAGLSLYGATAVSVLLGFMIIRRG